MTNFWHNRRVIVTGGAGFLGSYVTEKLTARGAAQIVVPRSAQYDLREMSAIKQLLADTAVGGKPVDMVIHLAANVGGIGANREHPADFFYNNLMMGVQLMHAAWQAAVPKFVALGTICAYPKFTPVPFKEDDLWNGYPEETNAPYGLAKKMMLVQAASYRQQYGYNAIYLLPVNLYGPRDNFDLRSSHVIPAMISKYLTARDNGEKTVTLFGDGSASREFLYADDAAAGILSAAEKYDDGAPVNLGSGQEITIAELAKIIGELTRFTGEIIWDKSQPNGQPRRQLDTRRAWEKFGFRAATSFLDGLRATIEWYEKERLKIKN
ncbi:GDP-L-fucose synthase [Planctomycetales bacterium]|nr:GDP-L-fucose synthase [Planctomycetales bacterium]GHT03431.1 GDP-L-fucose synthase [Planctomycetales bacterium]